MNQGISGVIIAYNESARIANCVRSLQRVCDEVVVVDSFSTDNTFALCQQLGCSVFQQEFLGHIEQKNFAQDKAKFSWILSLDADEVLSDTLINWLEAFRNNSLDFENDNVAPVAWSFHRLNHLGGKPIRGCGWYPDQKIRLWRKGVGNWGGTNPHDKIIVSPEYSDRIGYCDCQILHFTYANHYEVEMQARKFGLIGGKSLRDQQLSWLTLWLKMLSSPWVRWIKNYIIKGGYKHGKDGWVICYWQMHETFSKYYIALFSR
jgi:glycosyltransferase involved in cell wall biosynthesis